MISDKKRIIRAISLFLVGLSILLTMVVVIALFDSQIFFSVRSILFDLFLISILSFVGMLIYSSTVDCIIEKNKCIKIAVVIVFVAYLLALITTLFLNSFVSRYMLTCTDVEGISSNLIPFKTIIDYMKMYSMNEINLSTIIENIFGNLIMFTPLAFILPILIVRFRKPRVYLVFSLLIIVLSESLQYILSVGAFDIDDIILNTLGTWLVYAIYKLKLIQKLLIKLHFQE